MLHRPPRRSRLLLFAALSGAVALLAAAAALAALPADPTPGAPPLTSMALGAVAMSALVLGLMMWFVQRRLPPDAAREPDAAARTRTAATAMAATGGTSATGSMPGRCAACGSALDPTLSFCAACGT